MCGYLNVSIEKIFCTAGTVLTVSLISCFHEISEKRKMFSEIYMLQIYLDSRNRSLPKTIKASMQQKMDRQLPVFVLFPKKDVSISRKGI